MENGGYTTPPVTSSTGSRSPSIDQYSGNGFPFPSQPLSSGGGYGIPSRSSSTDAASVLALMNQAENRMQTLVSMVQDLGGWKPVLTHKSGAVVYRRTRVARSDTVPTFMGVGVIKNVAPEVVYSLVKNRSLWDEWFVEGRIVEAIDDCTNLSYMVIRAVSKAIINHRDLSLLDRTEVDASGTIRVVSSSVDTPKIPLVPTRVRADLKLNGWIMDPQISADGKVSTRVTYVVQSDVKGMVPIGIAKPYMARRALVVVRMEEYLRKYGAPPVHVVRRSMTSSTIQSMTSALTADDSSITDSLSPRFQNYASGSASQEVLSRTSQSDPEEFADQDLEEDQNGYNSDDDDVSSAVGQRSPQSPRAIGHAGVAPIKREMGIRRQTAEPPSDTERNSLRRMSSAYSAGEAALDGAVAPIETSAKAQGSRSSHSSLALTKIMHDIPEPLPNLSPRSVSHLSQGYQEHRHSESASRAISLLMGMEDLNGWDVYSNGDDVVIHTKPVDGHVMPIVRGDGVIRGAWTMLEVLSVIKSQSARQIWDARFEGGRILEVFGLDEQLTYTQQRGVFPVAGRDLVTTSRTFFEKGLDGSVYQAATSVSEPSVIEDPKKVRAHLTLAGWILHKVDDGLRVTYIVQIDIKGTIPTSLLRSFQGQTPRCVVEVENYLNRNGPPPFIIRHIPPFDPAGVIQFPIETYDAASKVYNLTLRWSRPHLYGGSISVLLPAMSFKSGAEIELIVQPKELEKFVSMKRALGEATQFAGSGDVITISIQRKDIPLSANDIAIRFNVRPSSKGVVFHGSAVDTYVLDGHGSSLLPSLYPGSQSEIYSSEPPASSNSFNNEQSNLDRRPSKPQSPSAPSSHSSAPAIQPLEPSQDEKANEKELRVPENISTEEVSQYSKQNEVDKPSFEDNVDAGKPATVSRPVIPKPPSYIPHRHTETGVKALKLLKALFSEKAMWNVESENQRGVRISTMHVEGSAMPIVRGDAVFPPDWTSEEVVAVIRSEGARRIWDQRFQEGYIKEWLNPNEFIFHGILKSTAPIKERDIAGLQVSIFDSGSSTNYLIQTSVADPLIPLQPGVTRAELAVAGWIVRPSTSRSGGVAVTYICKVDPKEAAVGAFPKIQAFQMALEVADVLSYLNTFGVPLGVKVLGNTGEGLKVVLLNESFVHSNLSLTLDYVVIFTNQIGPVSTWSSGIAGMIEVNVDPRMNPSGVDVEFDDTTIVESLDVLVSPDQRAIRVYPRPEAFRNSGKLRVRVVISSRDPAQPRAFPVNGDFTKTGTDKVNKITLSGSKKPPQSQQQGASARVLPHIRPAIRPEGAAQQPGLPAFADGVSVEALVKKATTTLPEDTVSIATSAAHKLQTSTPVEDSKTFEDAIPQRNVAFAIVVALTSLILQLLHPLIGGRQSNPSAPLDAASLFTDSSPMQLTIVIVCGSICSLLLLQTVVSSLFPINVLFLLFSPFQWLLLFGGIAFATYSWSSGPRPPRK